MCLSGFLVFFFFFFFICKPPSVLSLSLSLPFFFHLMLIPLMKDMLFWEMGASESLSSFPKVRICEVQEANTIA